MGLLVLVLGLGLDLDLVLDLMMVMNITEGKGSIVFLLSSTDWVIDQVTR